MMPRNVDPRTLKRMMKQLGIKTEEMDDVHEIVMKTPSKRYVFKNPQVTMIEAQGQKTFQVIGEPEILEGSVPEGEESAAGPSIPEEDVKLVAEKAGVSEDEARKALVECKGEPAEAIIKLMSR